MSRGGLIVAAMVLAASAASAADAPSLRGSIVVVTAVGVDKAANNVEVAAQATGFYVNRLGYIVTAAHITNRFGSGVNPDGIRYYVSDDVPASSPRIEAKVFDRNGDRDVMILWVPPTSADRPVVAVPPLTMDQVQPLETSIYTAGFPENSGFVQDKGFVKAFQGGGDPPSPNWVTSFEFKAGQSGSPVFLGNGAVIGLVKGVDPGAATFGQIVPSFALPSGVIELTKAPLANGGKPARLTIWATVDAPRVTKLPAALPWAQSIFLCALPPPQPLSVPAGYVVDMTSLKLQNQPGSAPVRFVILEQGPAMEVAPQPERCGMAGLLRRPKGFVSATASYNVTRTDLERSRVQVRNVVLQEQGQPEPVTVDMAGVVKLELEVETPKGDVVSVSPAGVVSKEGVVDLTALRKQAGLS